MGKCAERRAKGILPAVWRTRLSAAMDCNAGSREGRAVSVTLNIYMSAVGREVRSVHAAAFTCSAKRLADDSVRLKTAGIRKPNWCRQVARCVATRPAPIILMLVALGFIMFADEG